MRYSTMITLVGGFTALLMTGDLQAGPIDASRHPHPEKLQMVHEAEHSVDHAWEVYHRAALGVPWRRLTCRRKSSSICMKPELW
ncbi:MAG: hypothetical protein IPM88_02105 [Nitrospira sp.]|nr:hypothetical protein [Nitrospira sp.]